MSVRFNRLAIAGRSMSFVTKIGVAVAFIATLWVGTSAYSSEQIQRHRPAVSPVSDATQSLPVLPTCEPLIQSATPGQVEHVMAVPTGQNSAQVLIAIGQRVREIENNMMLVFAITRELTEFSEKEKSLRASVAGEITLLQKIRENFRNSRRLGKADEMLAAALERQTNLIASYKSLKDAHAFLSDWQQSSTSKALLAEVRQDLEQMSQRAVATGRGASHHAKIMELLSAIGRFEDLISASGWGLTQQNLEAFQDISLKLWGEQTLAVLDASRHTERFSSFPINQAIAEGIENLRPTRGDLGREPENELVIEKSIYGYDLLFVDGKLSEMNDFRQRYGVNRHGNSVKRKNIALLDPNLSVEGISRGTILTDTSSRFFKPQSVAVLGFFPNGDVLVQQLAKPGVRPAVKSISLKRAKSMKSVGTSNINRMPLIGDVAYAPSAEDLEKGKISLYSPRNGFGGLFSRAKSSDEGFPGVFKVPWGVCSILSCVAGVTAVGLGGILGNPDAVVDGVGLILQSFAAAAVTYHLPRAFTRSHEKSPPSKAVTRSTMAKLPGSTGGSLLLRSEDMWIGSNSLTSDEREALGIREGEDWLISTIGEKLRIVRPGYGED